MSQIKRGRGRPRLLASARQRRKVLLALLKGVPFEHAGGAAGVSKHTVYVEMERDPTFAAQVAAARVKGNYRLVAFVEQEGLKDGKLGLAILKARDPAYQQQKNVTVQGHVEHTHQELPIEQRRAGLIDIIATLRGRGGVGADTAALNGNGKHNGNGHN